MPSNLSVESLIKQIERLPQAEFIYEQDAIRWAESVIKYESKKAHHYVNRAAGFGGSDMGVLLAHLEGRFHPYLDAHQVLRSKFFMDPAEEPIGHRKRGFALEPLAKQHYRSIVESRGGKSRDDLIDSIAKYQKTDREHSWMLGRIDDIIEENGVIYIIDYKSPSAKQFHELKRKDAAFYHVAQLHHYRNIAEQAGVEIGGLRLYAFGADEWDGFERMVPFDLSLSNKLIEVGEHFWNDFCMKGKLVPKIVFDEAQDIETLKLRTEETVDGFEVDKSREEEIKNAICKYGDEIFGSSILIKKAESNRERLKEDISKIIPLSAIQTDVSRVEVGQVRVKIDWKYKSEMLMSAIRGALAMAGSSDEEIDKIIASDNFIVPATYSTDGILRILKEKGISLNTPEFESALLEPAKPRVETLAALLKDLERKLPQKIDWSEIIDYSSSSIGVEMVRPPISGYGKEVRKETEMEAEKEVKKLSKVIGERHKEKLEDINKSVSKVSHKKPKR